MFPGIHLGSWNVSFTDRSELLCLKIPILGKCKVKGKSIDTGEISGRKQWKIRNLRIVKISRCSENEPKKANLTLLWTDISNWECGWILSQGILLLILNGSQWKHRLGSNLLTQGLAASKHRYVSSLLMHLHYPSNTSDPGGLRLTWQAQDPGSGPWSTRSLPDKHHPLCPRKKRPTCRGFIWLY